MSRLKSKYLKTNKFYCQKIQLKTSLPGVFVALVKVSKTHGLQLSNHMLIITSLCRKNYVRIRKESSSNYNFMNCFQLLKILFVFRVLCGFWTSIDSQSIDFPKFYCIKEIILNQNENSTKKIKMRHQITNQLPKASFKLDFFLLKSMRFIRYVNQCLSFKNWNWKGNWRTKDVFQSPIVSIQT